MNDLDKERQTEGRKAWYAVQTFYCKEEHLGKYLEKKGAISLSLGSGTITEPA